MVRTIVLRILAYRLMIQNQMMTASTGGLGNLVVTLLQHDRSLTRRPPTMLPLPLSLCLYASVLKANKKAENHRSDYLKHLMAVMLDMTETKKAAAVVSDVTSMERRACRRVSLTRSSRQGLLTCGEETSSCCWRDHTRTRMNVSSAPTPAQWGGGGDIV